MTTLRSSTVSATDVASVKPYSLLMATPLKGAAAEYLQQNGWSHGSCLR